MQVTFAVQTATDRKLPVRSLTPGSNTVSARKLAPLETIFRFKSQPWTPPEATALISGLEVDLYRVPVTMSRLCACCSLRGLSSAFVMTQRNILNKLRYELRLDFPQKLERCAHSDTKNTYVMREVCVHDYHKISGTKLQAMDVGGPATVSWNNQKIRGFECAYPRPSLPARGFNICASNLVRGCNGVNVNRHTIL